MAPDLVVAPCIDALFRSRRANRAARHALECCERRARFTGTGGDPLVMGSLAAAHCCQDDDGRDCMGGRHCWVSSLVRKTLLWGNWLARRGPPGYCLKIELQVIEIAQIQLRTFGAMFCVGHPGHRRWCIAPSRCRVDPVRDDDLVVRRLRKGGGNGAVRVMCVGRRGTPRSPSA